MHEKLAEGNSLIEANKMSRPTLFTRAVKVHYLCFMGSHFLSLGGKVATGTVEYDIPRPFA